MWFSLGVLSAVGLGCYDIFKKKSLQNNAVVPVLFFSICCSCLLLLPLPILSWLTPKLLADTPFFVPHITWRTHAFILLKSIIVLTSWLFAYFSMKNLPITLVAPINATRPMWTLVGAVLIFHEQLSGFQWLGIVVALLSFLAFSVVGKKEGVSFTHNKWIWFLLLATITGALSGLYDKYLMQQFNHMAVQVYYTCYQCVLMSIIMLVLWYPQRERSTPFQWRYSIMFISIFLIFSDFVYLYALSDPNSLISVLSTVRRSGVIVAFTYGALVMHDKNPKEKTLCLLGVLLGMIFLFLGTI